MPQSPAAGGHPLPVFWQHHAFFATDPIHVSLPAKAAKGGASRGSKPAKGGASRGSKIAKGGGGGAMLAGFLRKAHTRVWTVQALAAIQQHTILNRSRTTGFANAKETTN